MKKIIYYLGIVVLSVGIIGLTIPFTNIAYIGLAQTQVDYSQIKNAPNIGAVIIGNALPPTCKSTTPADTFVRTTDNTYWYCTAGNIWVQLTTGGGVNYSSGLTGTIVVDNGAHLLDIATAVVPQKAVSETITGLWTFSNAIAISVTAFGSLPVCNGASEGTMKPVSDSNTAVWGANVAAGGANHILAYCNGTAWTVAAK